MNEFPRSIHVKNKDNFSLYFYDRSLSYFRRDIYDFILRRNGDETMYFSLDIWSRQYINNDVPLMKRISDKVRGELESKGWTTKTSFGGTGLFIYSTENPPVNCYEDSF